MHIFRTKLFILGSREFREADRIVMGYSPEYAKLELLARGSRKITSKLAPILGGVTLIDCMVIRGRKHDILATGVALDYLHDLKKNYCTYMAALLAASVLHTYTATDDIENNFFVQFTELLDRLREHSETHAANPDELARSLDNEVEGFKHYILREGGWTNGVQDARTPDYGFYFPSSFAHLRLTHYLQ